MVLDRHEHRPRSAHGDGASLEALALALEDAPVAFAVTHGADHIVAFANQRFRSLVEAADRSPGGRPLAELPGMSVLREVLDRSREQGEPVRDVSLPPMHRATARWSCTVWPCTHDALADGLIVELREATPADASAAMQREVAERMLLGALHEKERTDIAEASRERASFLVDASRRLGTSVDLKATQDEVARLRLHDIAAWCIVDLVAGNGALRRLAIIHPDASKAALANRLAEHWVPQPGDPFGAPAMLRDPHALVITEDIDAALQLAAHDPETYQALRELGIGSLLTVPMLSRGQVTGAITFVGAGTTTTFGQHHIQLAGDLAQRSALALDNAGLYEEAVRLRTDAQTADRAKSQFLAHISHELRTPLNTIAGYVDILDLEIHGPVTSAQHADLARIKLSQNHLLIMINDILSFMQVERGALEYELADISVRELLNTAYVMMHPALVRKGLRTQGFDCAEDIAVHADRDRTLQILTNLVTNAVKFTDAGGEVGISCTVVGDTVYLVVSDSGIGIPAHKQGSVFEPFTQVSSNLTESKGGVGLGLAISRDLARAMGGDLTLESTIGEGSRFTLSLPRARRGSGHAG